MAKKNKKVPQKAGHTPCSKKRPRTDPTIKSYINENPVWQANYIDLDGPWGWKEIDHSLFFEQILPKIQNFEKMTWNEILGRNNHEVEVWQIGKKARKRLAELNLDDFERLVSLRLTGPQRLWGIKFNNIFKILWWDPAHQVYPMKKK